MPTFTQIGSAVTVGAGGAASIDFTSIPSTYTDLVLFTSLRTDGTTGPWAINRVKLKINSITSGYSNRLLYTGGSGSPTSADSTDEITFHYATAPAATSNTFSSTLIYVTNYAGSTNKSFSIESVAESNNASQGILSLNAGLLSNTAAITSLSLTSSDGGVKFVQYSTAYLYGVSNA